LESQLACRGAKSIRYHFITEHTVYFIPCFLQPLSVELGPGILNNIFDGIQRPLKAIAVASGDCFIPRGVAVPAIDIVKQWEFHPTTFKVGLMEAPVLPVNTGFS